MSNFDAGPTTAVAKLLSQLPSYAAFKTSFWYDWGPIFYRGRLNKSARVLCIASDPGPTERIAHRTLVGDAGQRVQGFLTKLGLESSYICLNAFAYAFFPSSAHAVQPLLHDAAQTQWRNKLFAMVTGPKLQAIIAFGDQAHTAVDLWTTKGATPVFKLLHPSSHDPAKLAADWHAAIVSLRSIVTKDPGGTTTGANYGAQLVESDYAAIPRTDLPFGVPDWLGDDKWVRTLTPATPSSVNRPHPDDKHTLIWKAPTSAPMP